MNIFSPWKYHIDCLVDKMNQQHQVEYRANLQDPIELENWRDFFRQIPTATAGYVYLIVSQTNDEAYVGQTINFAARLKQHRTGHGANSTKHRRDWHCLALVTGFQSRDTNMRSERLEVEQSIHYRIARTRSTRGNLSPMQMLEIMKTVVAQKNAEEEFNGRLVVSVYTDLSNVRT
jgi:predicted GIY-YIG superfamily endonuclease